MTKIYLTTKKESLGTKNLAKAISDAMETTLILEGFKDYIPSSNISEHLIYTDETVINEIMREERKMAIKEVLNTLSPRESMVLKLRFGLEDGRARTLQEVGKQFDVTSDRIRQIEAKALRKLRHPSKLRALVYFLED